MRRTLRYLALVALLAQPFVAHSAIVWKVVRPQDCAGASLLNFGGAMANFASTCCSTTQSGGTNPACLRVDYYGDLIERYVELAVTQTCAAGSNAGNPCTVNGDCPASTCTAITYTTSGDAISSTEFKKIGLGTVIAAWCTPTTLGKSVQLVLGGTPKGSQLNVKLFDLSCPATGAGCAAANSPCPCCTAAGVGATCSGPQELASAAPVTAQTVQCYLRGFGG